MNLKFNFYWYFILCSALLTISLAGITYYELHYKAFFSVFISEEIIYYSTTALSFVSLVFIIQFLKIKYPNKHISQANEGLFYCSIVITGISCLYLFIHAWFWWDLVYSRRNEYVKSFINFGFFACISSVISSLANIISIIFSFSLFRQIKSNRIGLLQQISNIGKS